MVAFTPDDINPICVCALAMMSRWTKVAKLTRIIGRKAQFTTIRKIGIIHCLNWILPVEEQPYVPYQGGLSLTQYVEPPKAANTSTDYIMRPAAMTGKYSEFVVALSAVLFYVVLALTDAPLTHAIYGVNFLGVP